MTRIVIVNCGTRRRTAAVEVPEIKKMHEVATLPIAPVRQLVV